MWTPMITLVALVLLTLIIAAGAVTLLTNDHPRGQRALTLLKLLLSGILGSGGVFAVIVHLHQAGLL